MKEAEWNKQFNIGVDSIDQAHKKLFSIVRKLIQLSEDENHQQWACAEGIKYFKSYAIKHFADEESYMQSIGYKEYEIHKHLHDDMRQKTLPALEKDLSESGYSQKSIHHFLGICLGWLTAHIMIEDRAITGKIPNRWKKDNIGADMKALENGLSNTIQEILKLNTEVVSEHYNGEDFGSSIICRLTYRHKEGQHFQIFFVFEESLILQAVNSMLDMQLKKINQLVLNTAKEISQQIISQAGIRLHLHSQYQLESRHLMTIEQFQKEFNAGSFDYSILFNTRAGYFAFCMKPMERSLP